MAKHISDWHLEAADKSATSEAETSWHEAEERARDVTARIEFRTGGAALGLEPLRDRGTSK